MGIMKTLTINGVTYNVAPVVPASSVTLLASAWKGDAGAYSQVVAIPGVTAHTKVDLQPTSEQLAEFHYKVLSFVAENEGGVVTVYAIGDKPTGDHTIQITLTEVEGVGKIRGNTVGTTMPRPDWNETDPKSAAYIKNKPDLSSSGGGGGGVYVGSGEMPDGYNVQVDPDGGPTNGGEENAGLLIYLDENGNLAIPTLDEGIWIEDGKLRVDTSGIVAAVLEALPAAEGVSY